MVPSGDSVSMDSGSQPIIRSVIVYRSVHFAAPSENFSGVRRVGGWFGATAGVGDPSGLYLG